MHMRQSMSRVSKTKKKKKKKKVARCIFYLPDSQNFQWHTTKLATFIDIQNISYSIEVFEKKKCKSDKK